MKVTKILIKHFLAILIVLSLGGSVMAAPKESVISCEKKEITTPFPDDATAGEPTTEKTTSEKTDKEKKQKDSSEDSKPKKKTMIMIAIGLFAVLVVLVIIMIMVAKKNKNEKDDPEKDSSKEKDERERALGALENSIQSGYTVSSAPMLGVPIIIDIFRSGEKINSIQAKVDSSLIIGRESICDVVINNAHLSGQHLVIEYSDDSFYVQDLNTKNGTYFNGIKMTHKRRLENGDRLKIGDMELVIRW